MRKVKVCSLILVSLLVLCSCTENTENTVSSTELLEIASDTIAVEITTETKPEPLAETAVTTIKSETEITNADSTAIETTEISTTFEIDNKETEAFFTSNTEITTTVVPDSKEPVTLSTSSVEIEPNVEVVTTEIMDNSVTESESPIIEISDCDTRTDDYYASENKIKADIHNIYNLYSHREPFVSRYFHRGNYIGCTYVTKAGTQEAAVIWFTDKNEAELYVVALSDNYNNIGQDIIDTASLVVQETFDNIQIEDTIENIHYIRLVPEKSFRAIYDEYYNSDLSRKIGTYDFNEYLGVYLATITNFNMVVSIEDMLAENGAFIQWYCYTLTGYDENIA